ncbi:regulatory-associated protein of mTOR-like [Urocitellus parryii]
MVTSWQGLSDMLPTTRGAGMVVDWEQETGLLMSSGDVRIVRIWDTNRETKVQKHVPKKYNLDLEIKNMATENRPSCSSTLANNYKTSGQVI